MKKKVVTKFEIIKEPVFPEEQPWACPTCGSTVVHDVTFDLEASRAVALDEPWPSDDAQYGGTFCSNCRRMLTAEDQLRAL